MTAPTTSAFAPVRSGRMMRRSLLSSRMIDSFRSEALGNPHAMGALAHEATDTVNGAMA